MHVVASELVLLPSFVFASRLNLQFVTHECFFRYTWMPVCGLFYLGFLWKSGVRMNKSSWTIIHSTRSHTTPQNRWGIRDINGPFTGALDGGDITRSVCIILLRMHKNKQTKKRPSSNKHLFSVLCVFVGRRHMADRKLCSKVYLQCWWWHHVHLQHL